MANASGGSIMTRLHFVASYPKSGNTWVRMVCATYALTDDDLDQFVEQDDIGIYHFQAVSPIPVYELGIDTQAQLRPAALLVLARDLSREGPTLVKSHHACCDINGMHLWEPQWTKRVVVPVRDPRDVACSAADHFGMTHEEAVEFMANSDANIGGDQKLHHMLGSWSDHVTSWMNTERVPTHIVRYEDLHANTLEQFAEVLRFLEVEEVELERLESAIEACSFDRMQELEEKIGFPETSENQERFFRRGKAGGWRDELDPSLARRIEDEHGDAMERLEYL